MKKIPFATVLILFFGIILLSVLVYNYKSYTTNLDYELETQAVSKLSRINGSSRATLEINLANQIDTLSIISETIRQKNIPIDSPKFSVILSNLSNQNIEFQSIKSKEDLLSYTNYAEKLDTYLSSLQQGSTLICNTNQKIFIIKPYLNTNDSTTVFIQNYTVNKFSRLMDLPENEYGCTSCLVDHNGKIITSNASNTNHNNLLNMLKNADFLCDYDYEQLTSDLSSKQSHFIHYRLDDNTFYGYYSPTSINDAYLFHIVSSETLDQDTEQITSVARDFMINMMGVIFILIAVVFFSSAFYTFKVNRSRDSLLVEQQRYKIALSHSKDIIWEYDIKTDTLTKSGNSLYSEIPVISDLRNTVLKKEIVFPDHINTFHHFCDFLTSDEPEFQTELRLKTSDNEYIWFELIASKIFDSDKRPIAAVGQACNINNSKLEIEQLKTKSGQDALTKLYNHITLREKANEIIDNVDSPIILGCLFIDIDNFKELNTKLGQLFGDAVLIDVSSKLTRLFRPTDIVGRIGGDEFVILINDAPGISYIEDMAKRTERLFHDVYIGENSDFELSCSIGISLYPADSISYDDLFEKSEIALYHAKSKGRDCIVFYDNGMEDISQLEALLRKKKETESDHYHEDRSIVDASIIATAIDIMFDSREIDISLNMMLSLIGAYYNLNLIDVLEYEDNPRSVTITHEWCSDNKYKLIDVVQRFPLAKEQFNLYSQSESGVIYYDDAGDVINAFDEEKKQVLGKYMKSVFQCGISDHGKYIGYICASFCEDLHIWSKNEIDSLTLLSKIIGSYLIRLRSKQKADLVTQKDLLTNAYNFNTFLTVVNQLLISSVDQHYAMVYSDIFQFKLINDNYGYQAGDYILKSLSDIFRSAGIVKDIICRITGDKFAFLLPYISEEDLTEKANKILADAKQIFSLDGENYKINVIIGIYVIGEMDSAIIAVDRANIARKNAQKLRKDNYMFFNEKMRTALIERKQIEDVMEDALKNEEFIVYYQPKINMNTGMIGGAEALIRWNRPGQGLIPPNIFIPLFEDNGFVVQLDYFVLDKVCAHLKEQLDQGIEICPISVNFSRLHFKTNSFIDHLIETIQKYNIPAYLIEVEITESAFVNSDSYWQGILMRIRNLGFGLAMDDFGSGLSSLNLLCDLPFKVLKIDKDFFHSKTTTQRERIVISNIVRMAHELDMEIICEGVETYEQAMFLQSIGCYMAQGYYYDRPMSIVDFDAKYYKKSRVGGSD